MLPHQHAHLMTYQPLVNQGMVMTWWGRRDLNPGSLGLASVVVDPEPSILARLDYGPNNT